MQLFILRSLFAPMLLLSPLSLVQAAAPACGPQDQLPADQRISNDARWSSKSEVQSKSFDVFRSENEAGPFERINAEPIPAAGWSAAPKVYEFKDTTIDPCIDYYYYVEAVSEADGSRHRVSEVLLAKAKRKSDSGS